MCAIAGIFNSHHDAGTLKMRLDKMIYPLTHRGPDGYGFFTDRTAGLAHSRLSIIDLSGGWQPIHNENKTVWVIVNGEIYNYIELRSMLELRGHRFYTNSDSEVIVHLYEECGENALQELNGQFAMAIYDARNGELFLARDRMGVRPLYYTFHRGTLYFASEVKAIFAADPEIKRAIDPEILSDIFTFWAPEGDGCIFRGIRQILPGHWARLDRSGAFLMRKYWDIPLGAYCHGTILSEKRYADELGALLHEAVRLRLRADVPVGSYLSGGLDSSAITSLTRSYSTGMKTFSITFTDGIYDERPEQLEMVRYLGTNHRSIDCDYADISSSFPDVIWHTETPILRTAPVPLFLLSKMVREDGLKVVLSGEGADEILGGYDIFKEAKVRKFVGRQPESTFRHLLLKRLYPYLALSPTMSADYARKFFDTNAPLEDIFFSHRPRWASTARSRVFLSDDVRENCLAGSEERLRERYEGILKKLDYFSRAQYLESRLLLANYLLSSQGDRVSMAHSVEGRFPFLDHRVIEFACSVPPHFRMKALNEKNILKKSMEDVLPSSILLRKKQPYMAPDIPAFFGDARPEYLDHYLSSSMLREAGLFKPGAVAKLMEKCGRSSPQGRSENAAFVGILSAQIVWDKFINNFSVETPAALERIRVFPDLHVGTGVSNEGKNQRVSC